jgi:hypothetical protein
MTLAGAVRRLSLGEWLPENIADPVWVVLDGNANG